ncbi:serine phosphatase RsbU (regulator of sigma subunit) [Kineococcus xinjiangensis]|uniref:Serine phosphatase RsbU (Regulator of sigma subunit) n=1 Tax=Kineococcus xinjiangensis TaxID=512762 RepID=A0A2S6IFX4_9ACTN|nr:SpoIIE family protein phosphatase [Kineococcus xinjiangensis]PPK93115.1 serine phosphatase RsbU (regulator of sigma subunit) [Kineococcus xinjiangensis]
MTAAARGSWDAAPCALLTLSADGTVVAANATALRWLGRAPADLVGRAALSDLLTAGGRIYWETHLSPLLHVERRVEEVALELRVPGGRLPVLLTAVAAPAPGAPLEVVHAALVSARERVRYERELLAARSAAERSAARVRALQRVSAALSVAVGVDGVAGALLGTAVAAAGAAAGTVWVADGHGGLRARGSTGEAPGDCPEPAAELLGRGPGGELLPGGGGAVRSGGGRIVVPLRGHTALEGVLSLLPRSGPAAEPLDAEVLAAAGGQGGLALERARLHEHSALVAHELQRSLLRVDPPDDPRYAVATAYRPGVEALEVGGDFYDVFLPGGEPGVLAVVVGDVVGRGLGAAAAMGQLRSAVRAVAGGGTGPGRLLARLDRFVEQVEAAAMSTVAYAELDLATGLLRYACAGHLPPLLLPARGPVRLLWEGRSTPLGAFARHGERVEAQVRLEPGDRVLLCTDGLVERRERGIDVGLELLEAAAARLGRGTEAASVRALTDELLRDERGHDDVCVLLLTWRGPGVGAPHAPAAGAAHAGA